VTLVEVLVVVGVMVPLILAGASGLFATVAASAGARDRQALETALTTFAERLGALEYRPCATAEDYRKAFEESPQRWVPESGVVDPEGLQVERVEYWDQAREGFVPECRADGGAQRVVLRVRGGDREVTGEIVRRDPDARPGERR
jgi:type II secretory pathway pseudopilin PulG